MADEAALEAALATVGVPVFYNQAKSTAKMPYIIFFFKMTGSSSYADGMLWQQNARYDVELDEPSKDFDLESRIGDALTQAGIGWDRYEYAQDGSTEGSHWLQVIWEVTVTED